MSLMGDLINCTTFSEFQTKGALFILILNSGRLTEDVTEAFTIYTTLPYRFGNVPIENWLKDVKSIVLEG